MKPPKETKEERFHRLAEARVNKILAMLRLLGNLSHPGIYAYRPDQVEQIFTALQVAMIKAKMRFLQPSKEKRKRFSLSKPYETDPPKESYHPAFSFPLPDGSFLRAVGYPNIDYPCINIYWDSDSNEPLYPICFAEFNPEKDVGKQVCIGVYNNCEDDTQYYAPYMAERKLSDA